MTHQTDPAMNETVIIDGKYYVFLGVRPENTWLVGIITDYTLVDTTKTFKTYKWDNLNK